MSTVGREAVIYAERNAPAYFLGYLITNRSMTTDEILDCIGIDIDAFAEDMGWDGFNVDAVCTVPTDGDDLDVGAEIPEAHVIIDTPNGPRYIEIPACGEALWDGIALYDEIHGTSIYDDVDVSMVSVDDAGSWQRMERFEMSDLVPSDGSWVGTKPVRMSGTSYTVAITEACRMLGIGRGDYVEVTIRKK